MEFMCGTVDMFIWAWAKINTANTCARARARGSGVINLRVVKHALNVYFREFLRPIFKASKESEI